VNTPQKPADPARPPETDQGSNASDAGPSESSQPQETQSGAEEKMEIHHPDKPIHSKKDFIVHMLTVVLGILLALGFEDMVQWGHHRALVREAKTNLATEIALNSKALSDGLPEILARKDKLEKILDFLQQMEKGKSPHGSFSFGWSGFDLYSTAWKTAETSGATAYLSYDDLKGYTELYDLQQIFASFQTDAFHANADLSGLPIIMRQDPRKVPPVVLNQMEAAVAKCITVNDTVGVAATQLKKQYEGFQGRK